MLMVNFLSSSEVSLDVDADRDGVVEKNNPHKVTFRRISIHWLPYWLIGCSIRQQLGNKAFVCQDWLSFTFDQEMLCYYYRYCYMNTTDFIQV